MSHNQQVRPRQWLIVWIPVALLAVAGALIFAWPSGGVSDDGPVKPDGVAGIECGPVQSTGLPRVMALSVLHTRRGSRSDPECVALTAIMD